MAMGSTTIFVGTLSMLSFARSFRPLALVHQHHWQYPSRASHFVPRDGHVRWNLRHRCLASTPAAATDAASVGELASVINDRDQNDNRTVTILHRGPHHIVALKPPGVVCHHSGWAGSRGSTRRGEEPEIPMLQRVRDAMHDLEARGRTPGEGEEDREEDAVAVDLPVKKVNLIHRLDRGASGALLMTYADEDEDADCADGINDDERDAKKGNTAQLIEALQSPHSTKTYVALVRGEGVLRGDDLQDRGWFEVSRPIKDEGGRTRNATTSFRFVAGQPEDGRDRPRVSLVLARPREGRWHQIRRHLNGLSHPILGDSTHGNSKTNREWRERNLPGERLALHLGRLEVAPTENTPEGLDVAAPLPEDMRNMLRVYAPDVLERASPVLKEEGIIVEATELYEVGRYTIPEALREARAMWEAQDKDVEILCESAHYVVVRKPPAVEVHHWQRPDPARPSRHGVPMLQRARDRTGRMVNLVHRLDRGASGCLLLTFATGTRENSADGKVSCGVTRTLIDSMQHPRATKTYLALCDGDGTWNGVDHASRGWFTFDRPVKDEGGRRKEDCRTEIRFVASTILPAIGDEADDDHHHPQRNTVGRKVSIVLARPRTGRWHQIRQHLASGTLGHAILGDSSHGRSRTNRRWREERRLRPERTCLHLCRLQLPATKYSPGGIDVSCPLSPDLVRMLDGLPREFLEEARPILAAEGVHI